MPPIQPYALILFLLFIAPSAFGQTLIFPDLKGEALIEALRNTYRPNVVLSYADARDELFSYTANADNDTLRCVYSGYAIYLPSNEDPSSYAYDNGIDTEHTYPQSKGAADQPAKSDMHHLFPVRSNVNSSRGNDPYAEIPTHKPINGTEKTIRLPPYPAPTLTNIANTTTKHKPSNHAKTTKVMPQEPFFISIPCTKQRQQQPTLLFSTYKNKCCTNGIDKTQAIAANNCATNL
jgi:hypothetical protein